MRNASGAISSILAIRFLLFQIKPDLRPFRVNMVWSIRQSNSQTCCREETRVSYSLSQKRVSLKPYRYDDKEETIHAFWFFPQKDDANNKFGGAVALDWSALRRRAFGNAF